MGTSVRMIGRSYGALLDGAGADFARQPTEPQARAPAGSHTRSPLRGMAS